MKKFVLLFLAFFSVQAMASCPEIFAHELKQLHSKNTVDLCVLTAQKPVLLVNTASHCGFTGQFREPEALHQQFGEKGLVVIGFPSNDFRQEASNEAETAKVCYVNYGVTFTMLAPTHVRGDAANPVFRELANRSREPGWNFNKYLVDRNGQVIEVFPSHVRPDSQKLVSAIESIL